jgi:hypothetical protein
MTKKNSVQLSPAAQAYYRDRIATILDRFNDRVAQIRRERLEVVKKIQHSIDQEKIKKMQAN